MTASESLTSTNELRRVLSAPIFADSNQTQTAQYLNASLIAGALLPGLRVIMRRGYVKAASVILLQTQRTAQREKDGVGGSYA